MLLKRFDSLLPDLSEVVRRFPVPAFIAVALCIYLNAKVATGVDFLAGEIVFAAAAGFLAAGAKHLGTESWGFGGPVRLLASLVAAALAGAIAWFDGGFQTSLLFFFTALVLMLMVSPYFYRGASQAALWLFNLRLGLAALLAIVVCLVFGAGLSAVVAGLKLLLGIDLGNSAFEHIWVTSTALVGPVYGLSLVPRDLKEDINIGDHSNTVLERGVSVLVNYVLVPLVLVYALILHAYAAKIIAQGALPKGEVATIVSFFAVGGTAAWLIGWPWREQGTRLLRFFMRGWFWLIPVPAVLLVIAIAQRVGAYGWTPDRYGIAIIAAWIALVFVYLLIRRNKADLRVVIGLAAAAFLIGSFGPQGAYGVTARSQMARLDALLQETGMVKDGKLVEALPALSADQKYSGGSMIAVLRDVGALRRVTARFPGLLTAEQEALKGDDYMLMAALQTKLGLESGAVPASPSEVQLSAMEPASLDIAAGARLLGPFYFTPADNAAKPVGSGAGVELRRTADALEVTLDGKLTSINLDSMMATLLEAQRTSNRKPIPVDAGSGLKLLVQQAYGRAGDTPELSSITFWIIVEKPATP